MNSVALHLSTLIILYCTELIKAEVCGDEFAYEVSCPTPDLPEDFTSCCWENRTLTCCAPISSMDDSLVMMISVFVIFLCLTLSILFVVCCFWSPCPLYSVCRMNYTYGDIVAYTKEEEALSVPEENFEKNNSYTPLHIKVKTVEEE